MEREAKIKPLDPVRMMRTGKRFVFFAAALLGAWKLHRIKRSIVV
ncbi:hypothetical protein [Paenibacillus sp. TH7-28]